MKDYYTEAERYQIKWTVKALKDKLATMPMFGKSIDLEDGNAMLMAMYLLGRREMAREVVGRVNSLNRTIEHCANSEDKSDMPMEHLK